MPNTSPDRFCTHVNLAPTDLEEVVGGGPGFPAAEAGAALGTAIEGTVKNRSNIANAINSFNESGWNPIYNGISSFNNYMSQGRPGEGRWEPQTAYANPDGSVTNPRWIPNGQ